MPFSGESENQRANIRHKVCSWLSAHQHRDIPLPDIWKVRGRGPVKACPFKSIPGAPVHSTAPWETFPSRVLLQLRSPCFPGLGYLPPGISTDRSRFVLEQQSQALHLILLSPGGWAPLPPWRSHFRCLSRVGLALHWPVSTVSTVPRFQHRFPSALHSTANIRELSRNYFQRQPEHVSDHSILRTIK